MYTYSLMTKFINKKYYSYEQTLNMLDVYLGFGRISVEQYAELSILADEVYEVTHEDEFIDSSLNGENEVSTLPVEDTAEDAA